ncbi:hypothetical protein [Mameliella alba]|uniref:Uncharacterized protein n=1 Tax=Mameliella alba TaxID=561184 RepID=A0A0B3RII6_9RHOB|nr:hypothetical protein [Mameliella alba]KHQ51080.1 hypothetical protein OA50_04451 [Mameliella alba]
MKRAPNAYTFSSLAKVASGEATISDDGKKWYPARPEGLRSFRSRLRLAWEVFSGRADVIRWPGNQSGHIGPEDAPND